MTPTLSRFRRLSAPLLLPVAIALAAPANAAPEPAPAPLARLVEQVRIPYERFVLPNGLTVLVHTDRKAPIVGVTTYFHVGSKNEPRGKTGFAHLYEHLFFGGSENAPSFDVPIEAAGGENNGSTWYDRTNYVDAAPKGALALLLFLESDRMGHLLGAVTQDKLDKQRGVVENEKRQGDNQPGALVRYAVGDGLFPVGHPYRHATIGSMADLEAASLTDVRGWFTDHYAPNNAVLVISGDTDVATVRPLVEKYYGAIPRGPSVAPVAAGPVVLKAPVVREMTDRVAMLTLQRYWSGPGLNDADSAPLEIGLSILGGLASSRLDNALVRGKQLAVAVSADREEHEQLSFLEVEMKVRPGVARAEAEAAFDAEIARLVREGPTADEVRRAATRAVAEQIRALEEVAGMGGKGATLAEGEVYSHDPEHYRKKLEALAAVTPEQVRSAMGKWMGAPGLRIGMTPGERTESGETLGGWTDQPGQPVPPVDAKKPVPAIATGPARTAPPVAPVDALAFPMLERARLSNGIPVTLARRTAVPTVAVSLAVDAGYAADQQDGSGTQGMLLATLDQGTAGAHPRSANAVAEEQERLGASIAASGQMDTSLVTLSALSANLGPSLALMADVALHPAIAEADVARVRNQRLAAIAAAETNPQSMAVRRLNPLLFGAGHPYAQPADGLGTVAGVTALTPVALRTAHDKWFRPDLARITVVGDVTMAELMPLLEASFGGWKAPASAKPAKPIDAAVPVPAAGPRVVLVDRPKSPQSVIFGGRVLPLTGRTPDAEPLEVANEVLGADFLSRLNGDLREDKGWSYGVQTAVRQPTGPRSLVVYAPVQTDRTGDSLKAILADMKAFPAARPVSPEEVQRVTDGNVRSLPGRYETNADVLGAIQANDRLGRPDDYIATLPARYRAIDAARIDKAAAQYLQPDGLAFVIVGDRAAVEPQLKAAGVPYEIAPPAK